MTVPPVCKDCVLDWGIASQFEGNTVQLLTAFLNTVPPSRRRPVVSGVRVPRCTTHTRNRRTASKTTQHETYVIRTYGLGPGDYDRLYESQNGRCAICQKAKGYSKRLAVDHDHNTGLAYGLLCGPCNKDVLGQSGRSIEFFERCIEYLRNPPARQLRIVAIHKDNRKAGESDG